MTIENPGINVVMLLSIYCLKLENNKYYLGIGPLNLSDHFDNKIGWTSMYKPVFIMYIKQISVSSEACVHKILYKLMAKYGIDNVRGGKYSEIELPHYARKYLYKKIFNLDNISKPICMKCGSTNDIYSFCQWCY